MQEALLVKPIEMIEITTTTDNHRKVETFTLIQATENTIHRVLIIANISQVHITNRFVEVAADLPVEVDTVHRQRKDLSLNLQIPVLQILAVQRNRKMKKGSSLSRKRKQFNCNL